MRLSLNNPVRPIDTDLIFFGEPGRDKVRRPYEFRPAWHRSLKLAGINGLRFHDLRHEAVSRLVAAIRTEGDSVGWLRFFLVGVAEIADDATRTALV